MTFASASLNKSKVTTSPDDKVPRVKYGHNAAISGIGSSRKSSEKMNNSSTVNSTNGTSSPQLPVPPPIFDKMEWIFGIIFTHSLLGLFIIASNMVVLYAFYKNRRLRNSTNSVLMSMAVADLLVGFVAMPIWLYTIDVGYNQGWPFTKAEMQFFETQHYIDQSLGLTSVYHLVYLHSLRSYSIVFPLKHRNMSKRPIIIALFLIWAICIAFPPIARKLIVPASCRNCFVYITLILNIGIPLVVITVVNIFLWKAVTKSLRQRQQKDKKALVTIAILIGLLLICFLPFMIVNIVERVTVIVVSVPTVLIVKFLHHSNSALNPVVYALRNPEMARTIKTIFCRDVSRDVNTTMQTMSHSNTTRTVPATIT